MTLTQLINQDTGGTDTITHLDPVAESNWDNILAADTLLEPPPWTQVQALWEVFCDTAGWFNNREYTDWFLVVEGPEMWLCHYNHEHNTTRIVGVVKGL